jgi:hypothetical protein
VFPNKGSQFFNGREKANHLNLRALIQTPANREGLKNGQGEMREHFEPHHGIIGPMMLDPPPPAN